VAAAGAGPPRDIPVGPPFFRFADDDEFGALLRGQGLEDVGVRTIAFPHRETSPEALWQGLLGGTVRTAALIRGQTGDMQRRIRRTSTASSGSTRSTAGSSCRSR
jgi:hypothetical protein